MDSMVNNTALLDELALLLAHKTGLRIPPDAHERFSRMLHERAARRGYTSLEAYRNFLGSGKATEEWEEFARAFSNTETFFFRDHGQFDLLRLRLLPELIARQRSDKTLRLWSAGCASGEEAYSLAMLVDMLLPERNGWSIFISGTDIDSSAIEKARHGRYRQWSFRMVPAVMRQRYFHPDGDEWVLDERIRRMVTFSAANLVEQDFSATGTDRHDMNLILCRNMFIYFEPAAIASVTAKFAAALAENGYLMTGHTELIGHEVPGLKSRLFAEGVVYQRQVSRSANATSYSPPAITAPAVPAHKLPRHKMPAAPQPKPAPVENRAAALVAEAQEHADRGEYELAEQLCRKALAADPLAAASYFLLAQLAQLKGDFEQGIEQLNKAIYADNRFLAAYLELAALRERIGELPQAQALRHSALQIVRAMPPSEQIDQYERTAGELAQWLAQWELPTNGSNGNPAWNSHHGN